MSDADDLKKLIEAAQGEMSRPSFTRRSVDRLAALMGTADGESKASQMLKGTRDLALQRDLFDRVHEHWAALVDPDFTSHAVAPEKAVRWLPGDIDRIVEFEAAAIVGTPFSDFWSDVVPLWATLWSYMTWRFGPAYVRGNEDRGVSPGWMVSTPMDRLYVHVAPNILSASLGLRYVFQGDIPVDPEFEASALKAIQTTLMDLLRPVRMGENYFNATGHEWIDWYSAEDFEEGEADLYLEPYDGVYDLSGAISPITVEVLND